MTSFFILFNLPFFLVTLLVLYLIKTRSDESSNTLEEWARQNKLEILKKREKSTKDRTVHYLTVKTAKGRERECVVTFIYQFGSVTKPDKIKVTWSK